MVHRLPPPPDFDVQPRTAHGAPKVDWTGFASNLHLTAEQASYFPRALPGDRMLDVGGGDGSFAGIASFTGHQYTGVDISPTTDVCGDVHDLPFPDASFEFVLSLAALEHFRFPHRALREIHRVLVPGGTFAGTVAFLQPFHARSYYHHTHIGLYDGLQLAGFADIDVASAVPFAVAPWSLRHGLFPGMPERAQRIAVWPLSAAARLWYRLGAATGRLGARNLHKNVSGAFDWIAIKP